MAKMAKESECMNLAVALSDLLSEETRCGNTHVIAIDGRAGAGKTTLAFELFLALSMKRSVTIIHLDEIYDGWEKALGGSLTKSLADLLSSISQAKSAILPIFDWTRGAFTSEKKIDPCDVLIIEGVGSAQTIVRTWATATIWLDIASEDGLKRVIERDGGAIEHEMMKWQIQEEAHFLAEQTRENSDFILSTS
jgi:uridine kinase